MNKTVTVRIVRSDGQEMTIGTGTPWRIPNDGLQGFADLDYDVETSANVLTDGSTLVSKRVSERDRTIKADYWGPDPDTARAQAMAFFNPKHSYEAHVTYRGVTRWCDGELYGFKCDPNNAYGMVSITFTILSLDPYMRSEDGNQNSLTDAAPMFGFPYVSHMRAPLPDGSKKPVGFLASKMLYDGLNTIYNSGDVETYYVIHVEFDGSIENPRFTKDDRFIEVRDTFSVGDVLEIDFVSAPPKVTKNGADIMHLCSRDSNFVGMAMQVGANVFQYTCQNSANRPLMDVQIRFHKRYLGV